MADTVRHVNRVVSMEVTNCPRLFTLGRKHPGLLDRIRFHQEHYQLTLWCEHPGFEHAWSAATCDLYPPREWFVQIAPYARLVSGPSSRSFLSRGDRRRVASVGAARQRSGATRRHAGHRGRSPHRRSEDSRPRIHQQRGRSGKLTSRGPSAAGRPADRLRQRPAPRLRRYAPSPIPGGRPALGLPGPLSQVRPGPTHYPLNATAPERLSGAKPLGLRRKVRLHRKTDVSYGGVSRCPTWHWIGGGCLT
jgi:hypothetical protein